ncbi:MAG: TetR/AcrR family transcriptional regulator [Pseudomonadota bacterium]|nr:TetR/AcrR family transcriptional regulator [Pseudomonadota bacterium]
MGRPHEERRDQIVESALELAAEVGVKKVTTQAIADRVGIAQPTVFRHFKNRDEIFVAAIGWVAERLFGVLEGVFSADAPAEARLRQVIERQLALISSHKGIPRLLFSDRLHAESPRLKAVVRQVMDRYTTRVANLIEEGKAAGRMRADLDAQETARYVAALVQGIVMRWSVYEFEFDLAAEAARLWDFLWSAIAQRD